ncbi:hypothetical protein QF036_002347 [Arthrobacter globiformis]|nr:hypothetical protein [Arthrobacter globiformis]
MTHIDSQFATRSCMSVLGIEAANRVLGKARDLVTSRERRASARHLSPRLKRCANLVVVALKCTKNKMCTMCTSWVSDSVVPSLDSAGLGRFSGKWRFFKG